MLESYRKRPHPLDPPLFNEHNSLSTVERARSVHHLLDLAGIPQDTGTKGALDARVFWLVRHHSGLQEILSRLRMWHSQGPGGAGMVSGYCVECGNVWPCDTSQLIDGDYQDDKTPSVGGEETG